MFATTKQTLRPAFDSAVRVLVEKIPRSVVWALAGGGAVYLQGRARHPADLDIQCDGEGAYRIAELFPDSITLPTAYRETHAIKSYYGVLEIEGVVVELVGQLSRRFETGWETPVVVKGQRRWVRYRNTDIPVMSLEYELYSKQNLGQQEKAREIEQLLQSGS
ncbi:MAG: hypothetical protein AAF219_08585 [Myxococcota bacterium]